MARTDREELHKRRLAEGLMRVQDQMIAERDALWSALEKSKAYILHLEGCEHRSQPSCGDCGRLGYEALVAFVGQPESPKRQCYHCGELESNLQLNMCGECYDDYLGSRKSV